jgi:hypothetical protein
MFLDGAGMTDTLTAGPTFFSVEMGSGEVFAQTGLEP